MKLCQNCNKREVYKHNLAWCAECGKEYRSFRRSKHQQLVSRWKRRKGCKICGYNKCPDALHLDHIDPNTKRVKTTNALQYYWSIKTIKKELSKCQVLCANCHAERTSKEEHWKRGVKYDRRILMGK